MINVHIVILISISHILFAALDLFITWRWGYSIMALLEKGQRKNIKDLWPSGPNKNNIHSIQRESVEECHFFRLGCNVYDLRLLKTCDTSLLPLLPISLFRPFSPACSSFELLAGLRTLCHLSSFLKITWFLEMAVNVLYIHTHTYRSERIVKIMLMNGPDMEKGTNLTPLGNRDQGLLMSVQFHLQKSIQTMIYFILWALNTDTDRADTSHSLLLLLSSSSFY